MFNKALKYLQANRPEKALPLLKKIVKEGQYKEVYLNLGSAYKMLGNDDKAVECFLKAADSSIPFTDNSFKKVYPEALNNLGLIAASHGNDKEAELLYKSALSDNPLYYDAIWNLGACKLKQYFNGDYDNLKACWDLFEYRKKRTYDPIIYKCKHKLKEWDGITRVPSLVVLAEQGVGDHIMFARYLPYVAERVDRLVVQSQMELIPYERCFDVPPEIEHGIGICSLGKLLDYVPDGEWLASSRVDKVPNGQLDVGVVWCGNPNHANDKHRSTTMATFAPLSTVANLYNLNPAVSGFGFLECRGWQATIDAIGKLDLVVCVDTSIAHLCGALGKECWVIPAVKEPDWRWGSDPSRAWYKSVRVIENIGWKPTIERVRDELKKRADSLRTV